ncbi:hypothetical protein D3C87_1873310 [compost metagenome]
MRIRIEVRGDGKVQPHVLAHVLRVLDSVFRPRLLGDLREDITQLMYVFVVDQLVSMMLVKPTGRVRNWNSGLTQ